MKNIEKLRTLPDEKFCKIFHESVCDFIKDHDYRFCDDCESCSGCVKEWLNKEAKDE